MEYADILSRNRVLHGAPPFDGITVRQEDLRLQLEHESMGMLLKLRQAVFASAADAKELLRLMTASASSAMVIFRAVCRLHGEEPALDNAALVDQVSRIAKLEAVPLKSVVLVSRGERAVPAAEALVTIARYVESMERLVAHIDRYSPGPAKTV
jgi:hypothetical protein